MHIPDVSPTRLRRLFRLLRRHHEATEDYITREMSHRCGRLLGLKPTSRLLEESIETIIMLIDYELYEYRTGGRNVVALCLERLPPPASRDDQIVREGMAHAQLSICQVRTRQRGRGVLVEDVIRGATLALPVPALAARTRKGEGLAIRVLPMGEFWLPSTVFLLGDDLARAAQLRFVPYLVPDADGKPDLPPTAQRELAKLLCRWNVSGDLALWQEDG